MKTAISRLAFISIVLFNVCLAQHDYSPADTTQARQLIKEVDSLTSAQKYQEALSKAQEVHDLYINALGPKSEEAIRSLERVALGHEYLGDYSKAIGLYQKSIEIQNQKYGEGAIEMAVTLNKIGLCYESLQSYNDALKAYKDACSLLETHTPTDTSAMIRSLTRMGQSFYSIGEWDSSIITINQGLEWMERKYGEGYEYAGNWFETAGICYQNQQAYDKALSYYEKALEIRLANESQHRYLGYSYLNMSDFYNNVGDYDKAIQYAKAAQSYYSQAFGDDFHLIINCYRTLGFSYYEKDKYDEAISYFQLALEQHKKVYRDKKTSSLADIYLLIGNCYGEKWEKEKAIEYHEKAKEMFIEQLGENHPLSVTSNINIGVSLYFLRQFEEAEKYFNESLGLFRANPKWGGPSSNLLLNFGILNHFQGNYALADSFFLESLKRLNFRGSQALDSIKSIPTLIIHLNYILRYYYEQLANSPSADRLEKIKKLISEGQSIYSYQEKLLTQASMSFLALHSHIFFEQALDTYFCSFRDMNNSKEIDSLYAFFEYSKAFSLRSYISDFKSRNFAGVPVSLTDYDRKLRVELNQYQSKIQQLLQSEVPQKDSLLLPLYDGALQLRKSLDSLKQVIEADYPAYYRLKYEHRVASSQSVQDFLQEDQAMIEYFVGDSSLFILSITKDTMAIQKLPKTFPLEAWVEAFRAGIYAPILGSADYESSSKKYREAAYQLYQILVGSIDISLPKKLIIVPDGVLGYIPFDALLMDKPDSGKRPGNYPYLLNEHQVSYAYSATLLLEMAKRKNRANKSLLALAPTFFRDEKADSTQDILATRRGLTPLTHNVPEVNSIHNMIGGNSFVGPNATVGQFREAAQDYQIIHLSTHGKADDRTGDYSYLAFQGATPTGDSVLYVRDLYNMKLNADMVVLSACETGLGELQRGEGILSMARGFTYAGAKSIINTLWAVNDASTQYIMERFYLHLKSGATKDAALHQSKRDYLNNYGNRADPYYWAAFVPVGDMDPISFSMKISSLQAILVGIILVLLILLGVFLLRRNTGFSSRS